MRVRGWLRIGLLVGGTLVALVCLELFSAAFVMHRVRTEIEVRGVFSEAGSPLVGAQVVPLWAYSQEPASELAAETTNAAGVARFRLDLALCQREGILSSLVFRRRPHYAHVPYEFRVEHPGFESRVLTPRGPLAAWLEPRELPQDLDAKLVFSRVELQPLGSR